MIKIQNLSCLQYRNVSDLYVWAIWQKLPVSNFQRIEDNCQFNGDFNKSIDEKIDEGYFLKVCVQYPEKLHERNLPFSPIRMKIPKKFVSLSRIYMIKLNNLYKRNQRQGLNYGLVLKKVYRVIKCVQNAQLK